MFASSGEPVDGEPGGVRVLGPEDTGPDAGWVAVIGLTGSAGEIQATGLPAGRAAWVAGIGDRGPARWRAAGAALARAVQQRAATDRDAGRPEATSLQIELPAEAGRAETAEFVLGAALGGYRFVVNNEPGPPRLEYVRLVVRQPWQLAELPEVVSRSATLAEATGLTRDLANTTSNVKDPAWLAERARELADTVPGLTATVRDERWLTEHGFGGVLAVGAGSARPPRLVELSWRPEVADAPHLVLVGKGITFDTGGLSIKPAEGMHLMRTDMAGGAAVIAALLAVGRLELPIRVTGLVPCAENHVSGSAFRPGDVIRQYGGRTTEVTNTDAEGRLVVADALAYAVTTYQPELLVDVATLTGAMKVSLGLRTGGLFATDDKLAAEIAAAGERTGEAWWRMPLLAEHEDAVRSEIADVRQCPPGPGGITAALFLREFTAGLPWAHLDIAGPARAEKTSDELVPGATGFAARTLVEFVAAYV